MSEDQASVVEQLIAAMMRVCFCPSTQCESLYGDVSKPVVYGDFKVAIGVGTYSSASM